MIIGSYQTHSIHILISIKFLKRHENERYCKLIKLTDLVCKICMEIDINIYFQYVCMLFYLLHSEVDILEKSKKINAYITILEKSSKISKFETEPKKTVSSLCCHGNPQTQTASKLFFYVAIHVFVNIVKLLASLYIFLPINTWL